MVSTHSACASCAGERRLRHPPRRLHLRDNYLDSLPKQPRARVVPAFPERQHDHPRSMSTTTGTLYQVYRSSDSNQQAVHELFAYIQLWDDHEFANDCHGDFHPDDDAAPDTATTPAAPRFGKQRTRPGVNTASRMSRLTRHRTGSSPFRSTASSRSARLQTSS